MVLALSDSAIGFIAVVISVLRITTNNVDTGQSEKIFGVGTDDRT